MLHNFSIAFHPALGTPPQWFEVPAQNLDDALIALYEAHEDAIYLSHDIGVNPAAFEPENQTIQAAIESRNK